MKTKKEVKSIIRNTLNSVDDFMHDASEESVIGRLVMLRPKVENGDANAMVEMVILGLYMEETT